MIRLLVDDEPFDLRYGTTPLATSGCSTCGPGCCDRTCEWTSPAGRAVRVRSTRLVSFTQRAIAAVAYEVEPVDSRGPGGGPVGAGRQRGACPTPDGDPRAAAALESPLEPEEDFADGHRLRLVHSHPPQRPAGRGGRRPRGHGPRADHHGQRERRRRRPADRHLGAGAGRAAARWRSWSPTAGPAPARCPRVRDQVDAALAAAASTGWQGLLDEQRGLPGRLLGARRRRGGRRRGDPAGRPLRPLPRPPGRRPRRAAGHPRQGTDRLRLRRPRLLGHRDVRAAAAHLHRAARPSPRRCAGGTAPCPPPGSGPRQLGLRGAAFPWRTIDGSEGSAYWPAGTAAFHVNADIADAVVRYVGRHRRRRASSARPALELLVETARLWRSLGHHDHHGAFHIDGVTGPDEYSAIADDNMYTNLMAQANLRGRRRRRASATPDKRAALGVDDEETRRLAGRRRGRCTSRTTTNSACTSSPPASPGHQRWDFDAHRRRPVPADAALPLLRPVPQTGRQAGGPGAGDVPARRRASPTEQKARNFAYYEPLTVRDSSLSACCQAVIAAEVGHLRLAYDYLGEAALMDLEDLEHNTRDGLHIASLAGTWMALVAGLRRDAAASTATRSVRAAAARGAEPARLPAEVPRPAAAGGDHRTTAHVHPGRGRPHGDPALREAVHAQHRAAGGTGPAADPAPAAAFAAAGPGAASPASARHAERRRHGIGPGADRRAAPGIGPPAVTPGAARGAGRRGASWSARR